MTSFTHKPQSPRQLKVGEVLRQALSETFMRGDVYSKDLQAYSVTVSEVRVSPDLRNATVFIMPLGGKDKERVLDIVTKLSPQIRSIITRKIDMRYSPELYFKLDESYENAHKIDALIKSTKVSQDEND
ncbi:MAG: 30S ribosome-binding factor RbfA [Proteobacteria bacterium]|nr:30S ribosome-binding factor RbfA [Pseudomonadota bacterium]